ncbi:MAG: alpha/beta fold hydrolase [Methylocystis sp.]|uniref:esterase/lipase family protein n=1 Tax=Methylocystis sp. TaxID=1911079 RepID=UPI00393E7A6E
MPDLTFISQTQHALFDVVFVHGLGGDSRATWSSNSGYWPEWVAEANRSARVSVVSYSYNLSIFRRKSMTIGDHAIALLELLTVHEVGTRPLVFIAHGMGGVIVKELLQKATMRAPAYRSIWGQTVAVVFLATPVSLPSFLQHPLWSSFGGGLVTGAELHTLENANRFYRDEAPRKGITTLAFAAAKSLLIAPDRSDPGVADAVVVPLDASDVEVAKPESRSSLVVVSVQRLLTNIEELILEHRLPTGSIGDGSIA